MQENCKKTLEYLGGGWQPGMDHLSVPLPNIQGKVAKCSLGFHLGIDGGANYLLAYHPGGRT